MGASARWEQARVELDKGRKREIWEMQRRVQELSRATMGAQELNHTELSVVQFAAEAALDAAALNTVIPLLIASFRLTLTLILTFLLMET